MAFCPTVQECGEKKDGTESFEPGTALNGRRNAYLGTCIRQQAHSTTLDRGTELWGTSQESCVGKASAANLFLGATVQSFWFASSRPSSCKS